MAQEFFLGIKIGVLGASAVGASAVGAALGSARNAMARLGDVTRRLTTEQQRLGDAIRRHMGTLAPATLSALNRDYERLGKTIDAVRARQERLGAALARRQALADERRRMGGEITGAYATALTVGAHPQTGEPIRQWKCAVFEWQPILLLEIARTNRGQTHAIESLRNVVASATPTLIVDGNTLLTSS